MAHGLRGREKSTSYLRDALRAQWRSAAGAERHYTLVFPPLIFSFSGRARAGQRRRAACRSTQNCRRKAGAESPCSLAGGPNLASRAPLAVGLSARKISQPCSVTAPDQARARTEASAGALSGVRGREASPSWRDDGPVLKGSLTRSGADEGRSLWR